jgi:FAD/FMN-containing dehydrogenase
VYPFAQGRQVLHKWRDFTKSAPDELSVWTVMRKAPPLPFLPASAHGIDVVIFPLVYSGDIATGENVAVPVLRFGDPIASHLGPVPYAAFQSAFDPLLTAGARNYWKTNNFRTLSDAAIDVLIASASRLPDPQCEIFVAQLGGAMARVKPAATAFVGRDANYIMNVHGRWSDAQNDEQVRKWARQCFLDAAPHATGSGYVNFLTEDEGERVAAAYGANYPRFQMLKRRFDPRNIFRVNMNIVPGDVRTREPSS